MNLEEEFKPTLLNSVVYIISMAMQVTTFAVNYKVRDALGLLRTTRVQQLRKLFQLLTVALA